MDSWYPDRSIPAQDQYEEGGGRGCEQAPGTVEIIRKSARIVRRKHPTVDPRIRDTITQSAEEQKLDNVNSDPFSDTADRETRHAPIGGFCKWQERETLSTYTCAPIKQNNFSLHYREVSVRGFRQAGPKGCQRFLHLSNVNAYIEAYRPFGYTYICAGSARQQTAGSIAEDQNDPEVKCNPCEEVQATTSKDKQRPPPCTHLDERVGEAAGPASGDRERRTRSYLRELAVRLGVRESLKDHYFTTAILPSPPSITRNRQIDFILYAHAANDSNGSNGSTNVTDAEEDSEEQIHESLDSKLSCTELPPIPTVPKLTQSCSGDTHVRENSDPARFADQMQPPIARDALSTPRKGESSRETVILRTAQSLGLVSRKWSSRKHDRPSAEALEQRSAAYVSVSKGPSYDENKPTLDENRATRHNSSSSVARISASGEFVSQTSSQEKRGDDSAPANRRSHNVSQFTSVMRPQKLSRARRKLTAAISDASTEQDKPPPPPPPQISSILGIHKHRLIPP